MKNQYTANLEWTDRIPDYYDTFLMVKPGFLNRTQIILEVFSDVGYKVLKQTQKVLCYGEAEKFYMMHRDKPYFIELCTYMSSGMTKGFVLKSPYNNENGMLKETNKWKNYFRKCYGKDEMKNVMHTSDNFINLQRETKLYFFDQAEDLQTEEANSDIYTVVGSKRM